jgi:hypothetical protein
MIFYAVEITAHKPGASTITFAQGHGTRPHGTFAEYPDLIAEDGVILASDIGYRTSPADAGGPVPYPPLVADAFAISRALNLDPTASTVAASWGSINLANVDNAYDSLAAAWNNDGRSARVLYGTKTVDATRGIFLDPVYTSLVPLFVGVSTPWFLTDTQLQIPLRDATYWLERPLQAVQYAGTGTYEGPASLAGTPKPKVRGSVSNMTPILIDAANLIYQYTDGPGTVTALYEGASANHTFQANTTNLYAGSTSAGNYRTDNSRGLFQLGSSPVGQITADVSGSFPIAGLKTVAADIARYLLTEELELPAANINTASFTAAAAAYPYAAGIYFGPSSTPDGVSAVDAMLSSFGAKLYPGRDGALRVFALRALPVSATAVAAISTVNAVSVVPRALPATASPPPYRMRVAYAHNWTVQASGLLGAATAARKQYVATADNYAVIADTQVLADYTRPNDIAPIGIALATQGDAQAVAVDLLALWGQRRRLYDVTMPLALGLPREIGDVVSVTWPMDDLAGGRLGQVVGDTFRSNDATITLTVLI